MQKRWMTAIARLGPALLGLALAGSARAQAIPSTVNFRFSEQISNASSGGCGCVALEGVAADADWRLAVLDAAHLASFSLAADVAVEHAGNVGNAPYGLTLTTITAGPRFTIPARRTRIFGQALLGYVHGSNSEFPQNNNTLVPSANSFAIDTGAGMDYAVSKRLSMRLLQLDYLHTALPGIGANSQNSLRIGAGITLRLSR